VVNEGKELKITIPAETKVRVNFFPVHLELYFSEYPFEEVKTFSAVKPSQVKQYQAGQFRVERLRREEYKGSNDMVVEIYE